MAKVVYKKKKIDVEIQKKKQKLKRKLVEKTKNEASQHHELLMIEAKKQKIKCDDVDHILGSRAWVTYH